MSDKKKKITKKKRKNISTKKNTIKSITDKNITSTNKNKMQNKNHPEIKKPHVDDHKVIYAGSTFRGVSKKAILLFALLFIACILGLIIRLFYIQLIDGAWLKQAAYNQQTSSQIISAKRGNIYDSTGKALAISAQVDTVTINPSLIIVKNDESATIALKEKVSLGLSEIFELDYDSVLEKVSKDSSFETLIRKVEHDKIDALEEWMQENKIYSGIYAEEDSKRYYPYASTASAVLGFCNIDNQGAYGIEETWNNVLSGTAGKLVSSQDSLQQELPNAEETYIPAENGNDITLTIDLNIQNIVEKYLQQAVENNACELGGNVIVMDPTTGDILAMANYPNFDSNTPYIPLEGTSYAEGYDELTTQEQSNVLYSMWANRSVSSSYEPGSVFKIITSAAGLEENIVSPNTTNDFYCKGYESYGDRGSTITIKCWRSSNPHGYQTLTDALCNSCNPAFMQLASEIGASTLFSYYKSFGLMDRTSSGLYGEQNSIFHNLSDVGEIELATYSFGQRFQVTPLQMITAIAAVANDGVLMQPRIVKELTNPDTGATTTIAPVEVRQVISKTTADQLTSMMESVVTVGTGGNAQVLGYSIGGKTGTSEPPYTDLDQGYIASYVAISPIENADIVLLLTLHKPTAGLHQGGQIAGPVVSQMLSEILPYLEVPSDLDSVALPSDLITVPNVTDKTITEAKKVLSATGFNTKIISTNDEDSTLVNEQNPKPGTYLQKDSTIVLYDEDNTASTSMTVPNLTGLTIPEATNLLKQSNLNIYIDGSGYCTNQDYLAGEQVPEGTVVRVTFKSVSSNDH